jgi:hypothetical protein
MGLDPATMQLIANVGSAIGGLGALLAAIAAIVLVGTTRRQVTEVHQTLGAQTYCQLEDKFYHSDLMRRLRSGAAAELLSPENKTFDAYDDLGDFFDFIGTLLRLGVLDEDMTWNSYYRRATAFWDKGWEREVIQEMVRKGNPHRWDDFKYLVDVLEGFQKKKRRTGSGKLAPDAREALLAQERKLLPVAKMGGALLPPAVASIGAVGELSR